MIKSLAWICIFALSVATANSINRMVTINVCCRDDGDAGISNAHVAVRFERDLMSERATGTTGLTDNTGCVVLEGMTSGHIGLTVEKSGYYGATESFNLLDGVDATNIQMVLRQRREPVALYARRVDTRIPALGVNAGYDLLVGDWVFPFGVGSVSDLVFMTTVVPGLSNSVEMAVQVSFSSPNDGLHEAGPETVYGCALRVQNEAPEDGYKNGWRLTAGRRPNGEYFGFQPRTNFFLRIRSRLSDASSNELYGKIYGGFEVGQLNDPKPRLGFTYYLNPTGSRNLEFDPKQNLFTNLTSQEEVRMP